MRCSLRRLAVSTKQLKCRSCRRFAIKVRFLGKECTLGIRLVGLVLHIRWILKWILRIFRTRIVLGKVLSLGVLLCRWIWIFRIRFLGKWKARALRLLIKRIPCGIVLRVLGLALLLRCFLCKIGECFFPEFCFVNDNYNFFFDKFFLLEIGNNSNVAYFFLSSVTIWFNLPFRKECIDYFYRVLN